MAKSKTKLRLTDKESKIRINHGLEVTVSDRLARRVSSIANKVSETNMGAMVTELETVYADFPRADVTEALASQIIKSVVSKTGPLDNDLCVYAALIDCLRHVLAPDAVGPVINRVTKEWINLFNVSESERQAGNLLSLIGYFYNFHIISYTLIYDIFRKMAENISPCQLEHASKILKIINLQLRADDHGALSSIINMFLEKKNNLSLECLKEFRVCFLLETIEDLASPKMRGSLCFVNMSEIPLAKFCANLARKHGQTITSNALNPTINDIQSGSKWWLPGISEKLSNIDDNKIIIKTNSNVNSSSQIELNLLAKAKSQGMNTDIRRAVFLVMMTSEDYLDAFEKIIKLGLKSNQEREIVRVLVHCTSQEKSFNRFYALLAERLCKFKHGFQVTFQYTLWDFLRLDSCPSRKSKNMAKLYSALVARSALHHKIFNPLLESVLNKQRREFSEELFNSMVEELKIVGLSHTFEVTAGMEKLKRELDFLNPIKD